MNPSIFTLVVAVFSLTSYIPAKAQTPQDFATQVKRGVESISDKVSVLRDDSGKWRRDEILLSDVTYDVKKTDSALNPLIGVVHAFITQNVSKDFDTEAEATASRKVSPMMKWEVNFIYHPNKSTRRWSYAKGTDQMYWISHDGSKIGGPNEISREDLTGPGISPKFAAAIGR